MWRKTEGFVGALQERGHRLSTSNTERLNNEVKQSNW